MKFLAILLGTVAIVHSAAIIQNNHVVNPVEKTSILGPSGFITQLKNFDPSLSRDLVSTPVQITGILGPSGSIKQEQYFHSTKDHSLTKTSSQTVVSPSSEVTYIVGPSDSRVVKSEVHSKHTDDCDHDNKEVHKQVTTYHHGTVATSPTVLQYGLSSVGKQGLTYGVNYVKESTGKTSVVGPSGFITQENYPSALNKFLTGIYSFGKSSPLTENVLYNVKPVIGKYASAHGNYFVNSPSEKTSVVGPSGSITQEKKYYQSLSNEYPANIYNVVKTDTVTGKPVVVQHVQPVFETVAVTQNSPSEKTSVVGPSGSITQEKYYQSVSKGNNVKVYNVVKTNPVTGKPEVVQHVQHVFETVAVTQNSPSEKTSVVGPSGSITQEKYYQSVSKGNNVEVYNVVKTNPVTGKPEVVQHVQPVFETVAVTQNSPSEKTSVVGPSGSITQEKYYQSVSKGNNVEVYNVVKTNPVTGKPEVVQHVQPVFETVAVTQNSPSEKTSVVGPSGSITQEKYYQSVSKGNNVKVYNVVKTNPVTGKPEVVQHVQPVFETVAVTQNSPSEKTSVVGPSGSITQEKYYQSVSNGNNVEVYNVVKNNPVTGKPEVVQHVQPVFKTVAVTQNSPSEKTSVVGPSGSITQEKYYQSVSNGNNVEVYNVLKNNPVTGKPEVVQHVQPVVGNVVITQGIQNLNTPSEKTSVVGPSGYVTQEKYYQSVSNELPAQVYHIVKNNPIHVQYVQPTIENVAVAHISNPQSEKTSVVGPSGSITQEKYYQYLTNDEPTQVYNVVKQNPTNYIVAEPAVGNIVSFPSEKTSVVGPSGSITQEEYSQSNLINGGNIVYKEITSPVLVNYGVPATKNVAFIHGNSFNKQQFQPIVNVHAIKTTESHHSTSSSEETDCDESGETDQEHSKHNKNSVTTFYYSYPSASNFAVVEDNHVNTPVSYNTVNSDYLVHYGTPLDEKTSVVYGSHSVDNSAVKTSIVGPSGSITQESNSNSGYVTKVGNTVSGTVGYVPYGYVTHVVSGADVNSKFEYPEFPKYPDITAKDC